MAASHSAHQLSLTAKGEVHTPRSRQCRWDAQWGLVHCAGSKQNSFAPAKARLHHNGPVFSIGRGLTVLAYRSEYIDPSHAWWSGYRFRDISLLRRWDLMRAYKTPKPSRPRRFQRFYRSSLDRPIWRFVCHHNGIFVIIDIATYEFDTRLHGDLIGSVTVQVAAHALCTFLYIFFYTSLYIL